MREWLVGGGLVESHDGLLLVQNRRRDGSLDWSPPGGVIDVGGGESVRAGLTREVDEETGIHVDEWTGPVYEVEALAERLGWLLRVEVHLAVSYSGELAVNDPDGIVIDARFVPWDAAELHLEGCRRWVAEPLVAWIAERRPAREAGPATRPAREAGPATRPVREAGPATPPVREDGPGGRPGDTVGPATRHSGEASGATPPAREAGSEGPPCDTAGPGGRPGDIAGPGGRPGDIAGPGGRLSDTAAGATQPTGGVDPETARAWAGNATGRRKEDRSYRYRLEGDDARRLEVIRL